MSNPQQPTFFPVPFPMQGTPPPKDESPARVRQAVDFLALLTYKTMPRPAINDLSIEWQEGQKLIGSEVEAQIAACDLLTRYFRGKLQPDVFEKKGPEELGAIVNCPGCYGRELTDGSFCQICSGYGRVTIKSVGGRGS